jgi:hypothetical protein
MICCRCHGYWIPDNNDIRPFLFHCCPDGVMMAHSNPGFNSHRWSEPKGVEERSKGLRYDYRRNVSDR